MDLEPRDPTLSLLRVRDVHRPGLLRAALRPQLAAEVDESPVYAIRLKPTCRCPKRGALAEASSIDPGSRHVSDYDTGALVDRHRARTRGIPRRQELASCRYVAGAAQVPRVHERAHTSVEGCVRSAGVALGLGEKRRELRRGSDRLPDFRGVDGVHLALWIPGAQHALEPFDFTDDVLAGLARVGQ